MYTPIYQREPLRKWIVLIVVGLIVSLSFNFFFVAQDRVGRIHSDSSLVQIHPAGNPEVVRVIVESPGVTPTPTSPLEEGGSGRSALADLLGLPTATDTPTATNTITMTATATFTPTPTLEPGTNKKSEMDDMTLVYIPAGTFKMGVEARDGVIERNDQPRHTVFLDAYWISRTAITNAMYVRCVDAGVCGQPIRKKINPHYYDPAYANHPVVYITWDNAEEYCEWVGGALPTEAQWERAASGSGKKPYAWGRDDPAPNLANVDNFNDTTTEVGTHPDGASPFGVLDMGSNVREWVKDWYSEKYFRSSPENNPLGPETGKLRTLKGASWGDTPDRSRVTTRYGHEPGSAGNNRGFRCAFAP